MTQSLAINVGQNLKWGSGTVDSTFPDLATLVGILLKNSLTIAGIILLGLIFVGGFMFIANAGGDPKKLQQSSGIITNALIGFAVVFGAFFIIQIIEILTGLSILNPGL